MPKLSLNASKKTKHTPAGEIPVDWGWAALGAVAKVLTGSTPSSEQSGSYGGPIPFVTPGDVTQSTWIRKTERTLTPEGLERTRLIPAGSTVVVCIGSSIGKAGIVPEECGANQQLNAATAGDQITSDFLYYSISSSVGHLKKLTGNQAVPIVNKSEFSKIPVPLPPLPEQHRIADILSTWDRAIETLESLIAAKERRKQALMEQLLSGRKRLPGFTGKWPITHLGKLAENVSIRNNGKLGWDRLYAVTKANGMIPMREQVMGISTNNCKLVKRDDFAYNPMRLNIGSLARWQGDEDVMVSGDYIVFHCNEGELDPRYFDHLRRSEHWNQFVNVGGSGSVRVRLYFKDIAPFQIRCPSFKEQQAIAAVLDTADRELTLHRQHLATLRTQKRGLMQLLLTGRVRVPASGLDC